MVGNRGLKQGLDGGEQRVKQGLDGGEQKVKTGTRWWGTEG